MATTVSGFTFSPVPQKTGQPTGFTLGSVPDQVLADADGFQITQSLIDTSIGDDEERLGRIVLGEDPTGKTSGFQLTPEGKRLFDEFKAKPPRKEPDLLERTAGVAERLGEAIVQPFSAGEEAVQSAIASLGLQTDDPESGFLRKASRQLTRSGIAAGGTALATIGSAVNLLGQAAEETIGIPRAEFVEAFDIMTLFAGGGAGRLSRGPGLPKRPVTEGERAVISAERELPSRVPLTEADVTQDVNLQSFIDEAKQGIFGERAKGLAEGVEQQQDIALRANLEEIQRGVSGRPAPLAPQEAGLGVDRASQAIKIAAGEGRKAIKDAYEAARATDATIEGDLIKSFGSSARKRLVDEGFDVADSPKLSKRIDELEELKLSDGKLSTVTVNQLETWRKRVNKSIESAKVSDPSEAAALRRLKSDSDTFVTDLLDEGLIQGNEQAITAWKNARDLRADFGRRFESDKVIKKIVNDDLTQEESLNLLFGGSQMGFKNQSGAITRQLKQVIGEDTPAFKGLKEEAILRLVKNQSDSSTFSGTKFNTAVEKALKDNPTLMRELFSREELIDLKKFARFSKTITEKKPGATNPSGTFNKLSRQLQGTGIGSGFVSGFIRAAFQPVREARAAGRVERIINFGADVNQLRSDPEIFRRALAVGAGVQAEQQ